MELCLFPSKVIVDAEKVKMCILVGIRKGIQPVKPFTNILYFEG